MSYFCQFCDKEMVLKESVVFCKEYITCGAVDCTQKACRVHKELDVGKDLDFENIVVFESRNPRDDESWRIVDKDHVPKFLRDSVVMAAMIDGEIVNKQKRNKKSIVTYYCARLVSEVKTSNEYYKQKENEKG